MNNYSFNLEPQPTNTINWNRTIFGNFSSPTGTVNLERIDRLPKAVLVPRSNIEPISYSFALKPEDNNPSGRLDWNKLHDNKPESCFNYYRF